MKLHIFGASGSGVTTLGTTLSARLKIPYFDSDDYFWEKTETPFTVRRDAQERNRRVQMDLRAHPHWILGGSVIHWGDEVFPPFDLIVFLYLPPEIRMERLRSREWERYGSVLSTNPDRAAQFDRFLAWAADYDQSSGKANRTLKAHEAWLAQAKSPVLKLWGDQTTDQRIERVLAELKNANQPPE